MHTNAVKLINRELSTAVNKYVKSTDKSKYIKNLELDQRFSKKVWEDSDYE